MHNRNSSLDSRRIKLERAVHLRFSRFDDFVSAYSRNISMTGMFIQVDEVREPGTTFDFEASVADDWKLIRGEAQVVWAREKPEGEERPAGMGVRFLDLDPQSRRLIRWLVEKHVQEGGKPFDLGPIPKQLQRRPGAGQAAKPARQQHSAPAMPKAAGRRSALRASTAVLILLVAAVALALALRSVPGLRDQGAPGGSPGGSTAAATAISPAGTAAGPGPSAVTPQDEGLDVTATVRAWARAWTEQRVDAYLAFYARDFRPPYGMSRAQWEASRRERITAPRHIWVAITNLKTESMAPDRRTVVFFQTYRSDRFEDTIRKSLELIQEDGGWKILDERVLGPAD